jgi:phage major head subunit gpT-like protein
VAAGSDTKRSLSAETYGITTQLTRQDIINDDLNALSLIPQRIGRGAALSLNEVIWGEFLSSNSSYYQAASAGAGNALSFSSLSAATTAFRKLSDPDGNPLGITPRVLLVPPELELTAAQLMTQSLLIASGLASTSSKTVEPSANVLAGRYRVVTSNYLTSASTWWLMADAADLNALDVVFLNGQQVPTIEQVQADYQLLGVAMRGYMDFGVTKAESLSCYRMATA